MISSCRNHQDFKQTCPKIRNASASFRVVSDTSILGPVWDDGVKFRGKVNPMVGIFTLPLFGMFQSPPYQRHVPASTLSLSSFLFSFLLSLAPYFLYISHLYTALSFNCYYLNFLLQYAVASY